jgi:hypothetical protein
MTTPQTAPPAATRVEYVLAALAITLGLALGVGFLFIPVAETVWSWLVAVFAPMATALTWLGEAALGLAQAALHGVLALLGLA